jgi:hypothetical protein
MRSLALALTLALFASTPALADGPPEPDLPDWMRGFAGMLGGEVVEKWEHAFLLKVATVTREWEHSEAKRAKKAKGRTLLINLQWEKHGEGWRPRPRQVRWLNQVVAEGDTVEVDVANDEGERLHLMELTEAQRKTLELRQDGEREHAEEGEEGEEGEEREHDDDEEREGEARRGHDGPPLPRGFRGFSGQVKGVVARVHGDDAFLFVIQDVIRTWEGNEAREPESIEWRAVRVFPHRQEGFLTQRHARFITTLRPGQELVIELREAEGRVEILELNAEQRRASER